MTELETVVSDIIPRTDNVKSFRFRLKQDIGFKPGQYFLVTIKIEGREKSKHFSFSNSPTEKGYVEFTKRITQSPFSQALDRLQIGDWARLKMPYGSFTFTGEYKKIAFLSGGIGITAIRSICRYVADKRLPTDIVLLYGNSSQAEIIFRRDLDQLCRVNKNMRVVYALTAPDIDTKSWTGRTGYIDDKLIREAIPDYRERVFYICGPPKMVDGLQETLRQKLAVEEGRVITENFSGY